MSKPNPQPLVSIVIPCFNYGRFLDEAIESALNQTYAPVEILVVDDGSTDDTRSVAQKYADQQVKYHFQPNAGPAAARNTGQRQASGEFIMFLDADDELEPEYVELCLEALRKHHEAGFAYTQVRWFGEKNGISHYPAYSRAKLVRGNYIHASALLKRDVVERYPYNESLRKGWEDWDFYLTLAEHGVDGALVDRPLLRYRMHGSAQSINGQVSLLSKQHAAQRRIMAAHPQLYPWYTKLRFNQFFYRKRAISWLKQSIKNPR